MTIVHLRSADFNGSSIDRLTTRVTLHALSTFKRNKIQFANVKMPTVSAMNSFGWESLHVPIFSDSIDNTSHDKGGECQLASEQSFA